jgi:hypothetical protein
MEELVAEMARLFPCELGAVERLDLACACQVHTTGFDLPDRQCRSRRRWKG